LLLNSGPTFKFLLTYAQYGFHRHTFHLNAVWLHTLHSIFSSSLITRSWLSVSVLGLCKGQSYVTPLPQSLRELQDRKYNMVINVSEDTLCGIWARLHSSITCATFPMEATLRTYEQKLEYGALSCSNPFSNMRPEYKLINLLNCILICNSFYKH
jgi:hypothetical protein